VIGVPKDKVGAGADAPATGAPKAGVGAEETGVPKPMPVAGVLAAGVPRGFTRDASKEHAGVSCEKTFHLP
jgi:hypothetical protein